MMPAQAIVETRELSAAMRRLGIKSKDFTKKMANAMAREVLDEAQRIAEEELKPRVDRAKKAGPSYFDSFEAGVRGAASGQSTTVEFYIRNRSRHGHIIEHGSQPHTIVAKKQPKKGEPRLAWEAWRSNRGHNEWLPAGAVVQHPGTEAYKIMERAMNHAIAVQRRIIG